ncbi:MAG: M48 family metallopeptidase [Phycisphaeraceae bacterium]
MASNFFEQQDEARKKSGYLVALFAMAVAGITLLIYAVVVVAMIWIEGKSGPGHASGPAADPPYVAAFVATLVGVLVVVGGSSLYKIASLRSGGGESVAVTMGGTLLDPQTSDLNERKIMNVVEEMALASGTPVPPVYLMEDERGINAFAAGYTPDNAVIGITRGAIEQLSRDELQGVVAHEFSHILNGDMRLNIRLMGVIFGIIAIAVVGRVLLRVGFYSSGGRKKDARAAIAIGLAGLSLLVIGGIGVLAGRLIQAAVSRQREYLADASAVQFTRNPDTIGGALKRIGGAGSMLRAGHADEVGHMCIANAMSSWGVSLFATHPPLDQRIRRVDPSWDGTYPDPGEVRSKLLDRYGGRGSGEREPVKLEPIPMASDESAASLPGMPGGMLGDAIGGAILADAAVGERAKPGEPASDSAVETIGRISATHVAYMHDLIERIPQAMKDAAHDRELARAAVYAVLLSRDAEVRDKQLEHLDKHAEPAVAARTRALTDAANELPKEARLPLLDLAVPAMRTMTDERYEAFKRKVDALIRADGRVDLFEWVLQRVLLRHLDLHFAASPDPRVEYYSLKPLVESCAAVLSALAHIGERNAERATAAFRAGADELDVDGVSLQDRSAVKLSAVGTALDELLLASPREKKKLIRACAKTIAADGEVTRGEGELMRAVADALGVPMPPLLPGQKLV